MENYIMINGIKIELTEEQLKQLDIKAEKKRNNPFNSELKDEDIYFTIDEGVKTSYYAPITDKHRLDNVNSFNDKDFANQVYLHELLNRKLLKYAWDNNAEDCSEWDEDGVNPHYYIYFGSTKGHFVVEANHYCRSQNIYFSSEKVAKQAIIDVIKPFMEEHPEFVW